MKHVTWYIRSQRSVILVILLVMFPWLLATSPSPDPYHQFVVKGRLGRTGFGPLNNFAVVLMGRSINQGDSYKIINESVQTIDRDMPVSFTDDLGNFSIRASAIASQRIDSLCVAVILPDRPAVMGTPFAVDTTGRAVLSRHVSGAAPSGCSSCMTSPEAGAMRVLGYRYRERQDSIMVPF